MYSYIFIYCKLYAQSHQIADNQDAEYYDNSGKSHHDAQRRDIIPLSQGAAYFAEPPCCKHDCQQTDHRKQQPEIGGMDDTARWRLERVGRKDVAQPCDYDAESHCRDTRACPGKVSTLVSKVVADPRVVRKRVVVRL